MLPSLAAQIAEIEAGVRPPRIEVGNLSAERDFLHVGDVCAAYLALLAAAPNLPPHSVFNVASGASHRIADLLEALRARARRPFEIVVDPARLRPSDIPLSVGVSDKLASETGWRPSVSIDDIVGSLLDHWRRTAASVA